MVGLAILAVVMAVVGAVGCVVPVLPGVMLSFGGLLCIYFTPYATISVATLVAYGVLTAVVSLLDYILPAYMTKRAGGSKAGQRGATVGALVGIFAGPVGVILGPFVGAVLGEFINDTSDFRRALKVGFGSFCSFLVGTGLKLVVAMAILWHIVAALIF
ncbi:MAG: DUF456 domain-containing protein [Alistipes sp.]|nr:DUF456 domain-containing protein [Alistipes sp.]